MDRRLLPAQAMLERERYADAERVARDVLASDPDSADALRMLAMAHTGQEHYDAALVAMQAAVAQEPNSAFNLYSLAYVFTRRGELTNAERAARESLALEPDDAPTLRLLAHISLAQGRPKSALATADEALRLDPSRVRSFVARADALIALNRPREAREMLHEARDLEPNDAGVHASLGAVEATFDHHRDAEAAFREALRLEPTMEFARRGLIVAMKLRNPVYRALRGRYRFGFIIAAVVAIGTLAQFPRTYPVAIGMLLVALPVFLFVDQAAAVGIRLDRQARRAFNPLETLNSNLFLISLGAVLGAAAVWLVTRFDAAGFAAFSLGFVFLFVAVAIEREPGRLRTFILANSTVWAAVTIAGALTLASTGSRDWSTEFDRMTVSHGPAEWIGDATFIILGLQAFLFGMFMIGYCYFDTAKSTLTRSFNRVLDVKRAWPFVRKR